MYLDSKRGCVDMSGYTLKLNPERIQEMPMVDLAFEVLKAANTPYYYRDLMMEIAKLRGLSADGINQFIAQVYTEINIDGRFACVGNNVWGLKRWYPVERAEDPIGNAKRTRIINDEDDLDEEDPFVDEDDDYKERVNDFDAYPNEDEDEFAETEEEEEEVEDDVEIDEEDLESEEISLEEVEEEEYDDFEDEDDK